MAIERKALLLLIALLLTSTAVAAPTGRFAEWAKGPVQWLMTRDDQRAWRVLSNDQQAIDFIDLFWARRDPTPGTPVNEFKKEFEARVAYADKYFQSGTKRGALTDRGRVLIVLGPPNGMPGVHGIGEYASTRVTTGPLNAAGEHMPAFEPRGFTSVFTYDPPSRVGLTDLVIFTQNTLTHEYELNYQKSNVAGALADAVRQAILHPELQTVPAWARMQAASEQQKFQVAMVVASTVGDGTAPGGPPAVIKAISDLRGLLPYKRYDLIDSAQLNCRSGRVANIEMKGPGGKTYRILFLFTNDSSSGKELNVPLFNVMRYERPRSLSPDSATPETPESVLATSFGMNKGETLSVGSSRPAQATDALLFFVTAVPD